nr:ribonuclease H-like domain-containing protein [Tanacetum cinerariifolium]
KSQLDVLSYKTSLESVEARLVVYQKNEAVFEEDIKLLKLDVMLRENALAELKKKFKKAEKEKNDLKLTLDKFQTSFKNLSKLLESQVSDKTSLGFDSQVFNSQVFNCGELHSHESDNRVPKNPENDRYNTSEGYHVVPPLYTGTFLPPKPDLTFTDDPTGSESLANVFNVKSSINKPSKDMSKTLRPDVPIVEDWISDSKDETKIESVPKQREPSFVKSSKHVKTYRESVKKVQHHKQAANLRTNNQKSRVRMTHPHSNRNVVPTTVLTRSRLMSLNAVRHVPTVITQSSVQSPWPVKHVVNKAHSPGNPQQALNDKCVIDSGFSRHMTGNISFLLEFKEIDGGYVAFGGNPKGGKISGKGKIKTDPLGKFDMKADEGFLVGYSVNCKAFRVFNSRTRIVQETLHINFLENKSNVAGIGPKWLFDIDTLTMSMNYQPVVARNQPNDNAGIKENLDACKVRKETASAQQYVLLPLWSTGSPDPHNIDDDVIDVAFDVKENENDVHDSANGSDKIGNKKHDERAKRDDKGKSHVDSPTGVRDLRVEFEEFSFNSTNKVNAVSTSVNAVGPNPINNTNSFNTVSPSVNVISPNFGIVRKSSFVDPSKYPDDPDMPESEDIVYSDDEENVASCHLAPRSPLVCSVPGFALHSALLGYKYLASLGARGEIELGLADVVFIWEPSRLRLGLSRVMLVFVYCLLLCLFGYVFSLSFICGYCALRLFGVCSFFLDVLLVACLLLLCFRYLSLSNTLMHTYIGHRSPGSSLSIFEFILEIGVGLVYVHLPHTPFQHDWATISTAAKRWNWSYCWPQVNAIEDSSEGIDQIIDFLNAHTIKYALVVNPTIYVSCIKQFWATATVKKVNDDVQLYTLIDGKKVVVLEAIIRRDLHLDDADGVKCLPNDEIFEELARMGYEKPPLKLAFYKAFLSIQWKFLIHTLVQCLSAKRSTWTEFSHSMAFAVIYLATGRKFNFSKYIFNSMVRNVDSPSVETPLFASMMVQLQPKAKEDVEIPIALALPSTTTEEESKEARKEKEVKVFRVKKAKKGGRRIEAIDADEDIILVDMETDEEVVSIDAESQERLNKEDVNAASKGVSAVSAPELVSAAELIVFDDEDVTMTIDQNLIKLKA